MWERVGALEYVASLLLTTAAIIFLEAAWTPTQTEWLLGGQGIAKAIVGTFVGAALAFWSARRHDRHKKRQENLAAIRLAIATLGEQLTDLVGYRQHLRESLHHCAKSGQQGPRWAYAAPFHYNFEADAKVDLKSIGFTFEVPERRDPRKVAKANADGARGAVPQDGALFPMLSLANRRHAQRIYVAKHLLEAATEMQNIVAEARGPALREQVSIDEIRKIIGPALGYKVSDLLTAALSTVDENAETIIIAAARALKRAAYESYPDTTGLIDVGVPAAYRAIVPPLPPVFMTPPELHRW